MLLAALLLLSGCATAPGDLGPYRRELEARSVLSVDVGPELALASGPFRRLASMVDSAGVAHVVGTSLDRQIHYINVDSAGNAHDEVIGTVSSNEDIWDGALDIVEYPVGTIRIAAGDTEYSRAQSSGEWTRVGGNRCRLYLLRTPSLYCAFVASGEQVGTAARTDVNVFLIYIIPIVVPSTVRPGKLVLAERVDESWVVRSVIDPATDWSVTETDFAMGVDQRDTVHIIFLVWRGSNITRVPEVRYARFPLPTAGVRGGERSDWQEIESQKIESTPWKLGRADGISYLHGVSEGRLYKTVAISPGAGTALRLISVQGGLGTVVVGGDSFELLAMSGVTAEPGDTGGALLRVGAGDSRHVLAYAGCHGFWTAVCRMVYVHRSEGGKLATATLGDVMAYQPVLTLAIGSRGMVFAAWLSGADRLVGRWITPRPTAHEAPH